jgi:hypothetical protein
MKAFIGLLVFCILSVAHAGAEHDHGPAKVSPAFESMKALIGTWEGKTKMDGKEEDVKVTYELTSGGTTIVEKLNPGTPMEMTTVYANNGKKVNATHYCALGNQPQMTLKNSKDNSFVFEMEGTKGISSKNEMHMHGVKLALEGDKLKEEWTNYKDGKKGETHAFELTKKM